MIHWDRKEYYPSGMPEAIYHSYEQINASGKYRIGEWTKTLFGNTMHDTIINGDGTE